MIATLTDIGTEEMAHWEMIATMIHQCMKGASMEELTAAGLDGYYVLHNHGIFPADPNGIPFTSAYIQCTGDPIADLVEDMAAEQKARATYEHLMNMTSNAELLEPRFCVSARSYTISASANVLRSCRPSKTAVRAPAVAAVTGNGR